MKCLLLKSLAEFVTLSCDLWNWTPIRTPTHSDRLWYGDKTRWWETCYGNHLPPDLRWKPQKDEK